MKKLKGILVLVLLLALLASPIVVLASDISGARYYGTIIVSNNSTATTNVAVNCTISTSALIDGGYLNSSANNCVVRSSAGADLPFMPGANTTLPWCIWVASIGENSHFSDILYTADSSGGKIRYFPTAEGMNRDDSGSMELGDNFSVIQSGWWDTSTAGEDIAGVEKFGAVRAHYISGTGNISSEIFTFGDDFDTDGWTDVGAKIVVNTTTKRLEYESENSAVDTRCFYDLTAVSDTKWSLSFTFQNTASTHALAQFDFGLMEIAENIQGITGDGITMRVSTTTPNVLIKSYDEGASLTSTNIAITDNITYYATLERVSAIVATLSIFSDAARTTHITDSPVSLTINATTVGLRYIQGSNEDNNAGAEREEIGWIDDLFFGEGLNEVTATGVATGEHIIETKADQTLFGIGKDTVNADFPPVSDNLVFNGMFWHPESNASPFLSKDVNQHSCTVTGATWTSDGYVFDGNDRISLPAGQGLTPATGTFVFWIKLVDTGNSEYIFSSGATELAIRRWGAGSGTITFYYDGASEQEWAIASTVGDWTHFALEFKQATTVKGWEDTIQKDTSGCSATAPTEATPQIGAHSGGHTALEGTIGEFRIYGKRLSQAEVEADYNASKWKYETSSDEYFHYNVLPTGDVPDNANDWAFLQNDVMPYMEYHTISVNGTQVQYIDWEYDDTTFSDNSSFNNDVIPTFRTTPSDPDVSAVLTSFLPVAEAQAPAYALEDAPPFIDADRLTGNVTGVFTTVPPAGTFPLAGVITTVANATSTPPQLPLLIIAVFVILACSLTVSATMRRYGSGSLIAKIIAITAVMGVFIGLGNFGIDDWMLYVFLVIAVALAMASRQTTWA